MAMGSGLQNHDVGSTMMQEAPVNAWRLLRSWVLGSSLGAVALLVPVAANAKESQHASATHLAKTHHTYILPADYHHSELGYAGHKSESDATLMHADYRTDHGYYHSGQRVRAHFSYSRLQCVPYAREVSHIELSGDAFLWWAEAAGRYERSHMPVIGAVLNFRSTGRMPLGHVAVVTAVLDSRTILVTQANWVPGTITNDVTVQDVSAANNWSAVRVEYGNGSVMGSTYPTYGFIYNKPASAPTIYAANDGGRNEVAEAPAAPSILAQAPNRSLR